MSILVRREHAVNVIVLVDRFTVVAAFLLVPPVGVGITELTLFRRRIDISTILVVHI